MVVGTYVSDTNPRTHIGRRGMGHTISRDSYDVRRTRINRPSLALSPSYTNKPSRVFFLLFLRLFHDLRFFSSASSSWRWTAREARWRSWRVS